ncbi:hypothetical protein G5714_024577 [Onychostoma macrolepis]|uniref:Uncharacterized protein n=1 Tax=Onychostoma macrolepis TaxID=369639 RepID=A0A7J6BI97_9TELE|nr:hypothetical protein G5714_024577 [Onychostoma macrolepis]
MGNLAPAAFLGCGSRFSGSLSESNPDSLLPVVTMKLNADRTGSQNYLASRSLAHIGMNQTNRPPTKNGHAPPPTESRKSYQSVNPFRVRAGFSFATILPGTQRLWFPARCPAGHGNNAAGSLVGIATVGTTTVSDRLRTSDFRS